MEKHPLGQLRTVSGGITPGERSSRTLRIRNAAMATSLDLQGKRVLDVGCAEGLHSLYMAVHAAEVVGVDHRASVIAIAHNTAKAVGINNVSFLQGDIRDARFFKKIGTFDIVVAWGLLHRVADPISALGLLCSLSGCLSLEWRTPLIPFAGRISMAYHNPVAEKLDPMNIARGGNLEPLEPLEPLDAAGENKIESSSGFWEPTIGAVRAIVCRHGINNWLTVGYGDRFSSGFPTGLRKWGTQAWRYACRRKITHQVPVGRVHAMAWRSGSAVGLSDPGTAASRIPSWDLAMTGQFTRDN